MRKIKRIMAALMSLSLAFWLVADSIPRVRALETDPRLYRQYLVAGKIDSSDRRLEFERQRLLAYPHIQRRIFRRGLYHFRLEPHVGRLEYGPVPLRAGGRHCAFA